MEPDCKNCNYRMSLATYYDKHIWGKDCDCYNTPFCEEYNSKPEDVTVKALICGKTIIGVRRLGGTEKTVLCIETDEEVTVYGQFFSVEDASEFMDRLCKLVGAKEADDGNYEKQHQDG